MVLVAHEPEVVVGEIEDRLDAGVELHSRERVRRACELGVGLIQVVEIQVRVSQGVHELAGLEPGDLGDHHREQRVRRDVERFTAIPLPLRANRGSATPPPVSMAVHPLLE